MSGNWAVGKTVTMPRIRGSRAIQNLNRIRPVKEKKMKRTLKERFRNWLFDHDNDDHAQVYVDESVASLESNGMRFQLYRATGGYVVEVRSYDENKDRNFNSMYVITDDNDLGAELGKIVTMECLKR
jgi:hypothetical protein